MNANLLTKLNNAIASVFNSVQMKLVQTTDGKELDFYELQETDDIKAGDKALIDGKPATGKFLIKINDKTVELEFDENGAVVSVKEVEADAGDNGGQTPPDESEVVMALKKENKELRKAIAELKGQFAEMQKVLTTDFKTEQKQVGSYIVTQDKGNKPTLLVKKKR